MSATRKDRVENKTNRVVSSFFLLPLCTVFMIPSSMNTCNEIAMLATDSTDTRREKVKFLRKRMRTMKRRRRGEVDASALSRKQARRKAEEKLKKPALQRNPERLNGSLNVSSLLATPSSFVPTFPPFVARG